MVTIENILKVYPQLPQSKLPTALQQGEFEFVETNIDLYNDDDVIKQYIDTFCLKLDEQIQKGGQVVGADGVLDENKKVLVVTSKCDSDEPRITKKQPQKTTSKKTKTANPNAIPIERLSDDLVAIKRYVNMHGKVKTQAQILSFLHWLQKAITERRIRKSSKYSKEITQIQEQLIKCYNQMGESVKLEINENNLAHYQSIVEGYNPMLSVTYLKRYISLHGKQGIKNKAQRLYEQIGKAVNSGKITKDDTYADALEKAFKRLHTFINSSDKVMQIEQAELRGLQGLNGDGLGFIGKVVRGVMTNLISNSIDRQIVAQHEKGKMVSSTELAGMTFETLSLEGEYRELIGTPSRSFSAMVYGKPGGGKTTWCISFAKYLAQQHDLQVLFASIEEGINHTAQDKLRRLNATHPNLIVSDYMPEDLSQFDVVFIDSVNSFRYSVKDLQRLRKANPNIILIYIFQSTKNGQFKGSQEYEHDVDVVIRAEDGVITTQGCKNRFGKTGTMRVW